MTGMTWASEHSLHITETRHDLRFDEWVAHCRCGWTGSYLPTRDEARRDGDRHLADANAEGAT